MGGGSGDGGGPKRGGGGGGGSLPDNQQPGEVFRQAQLAQRQNMKDNIASIDAMYEKAQRSETATSEQRYALRQQKKEYQKKVNALESEYRTKTGLFL